ncbi:MAG: hypothetical protein CL608_18990 [Anaerolineaceae bacterium]|nr:hypothetical protein [Anaerolineaceae bacterium]
MRRTFLLLCLLLLLPTPFVQAQTAVTLESLEVELWPDYDEEAVLVLLTGTLAPNIPLPATLTLPLPDGADFNVAARITPENVMTDQGMTPQVANNQVTFTTPDNRFRVEYYQPYEASDTQHAFTFSWQSDITVEQISVKVQQPVAATDMSVIPAPASVSDGQDGLTYHLLPNQAVAAGDTYNVEVGYTMNTPTLTVNFLSESEETSAAGEELPFLDAVPVEEGGFDWQLFLVALGVLILVATAVWYLASNRAATNKRRPAKPKPQRSKPETRTAAAQATFPGKVNFCHQCGEPLQAEDKFCRNCGTAVKGK